MQLNWLSKASVLIFTIIWGIFFRLLVKQVDKMSLKIQKFETYQKEGLYVDTRGEGNVS